MESDQPPSPFTALLILLPVQAVFPETSTLVSGGILLLVLLFLSAVFSGAEVALFSLDASDKEKLSEQDDASSRRVLRLLETPRALLVSILVLNTLVNVAAAILTAILTQAIARSLSWNSTLTLLSEVIILTFLLLVLSEITPKLIATRNAAAFARKISIPLLFLHRLLKPLSGVMARSMDSFHGRFRALDRRISGEDLKAMAEIGEAHGTIEEEERELIHSIVEFGDTRVREIMISRLDVVALSAGASVSEAIELIRKSGHSRLPLYFEHLDNILGIVYAKDLLRYLARHNDEEHIDWTRLARPPMFVPLGKKLDDLLRNFQNRKTHIALVVDEYGGTAGVVTLEDVLEEIVGEIRDEHDESEVDPFEQLGPHRYRFDAKIDLDELNEIVGTDLDTEDFDFETLGGLVLHLAGVIPSEGDVFRCNGLTLTVESVVNHRIVGVLVTVDDAGTDASMDSLATETASGDNFPSSDSAAPPAPPSRP